MISLLSQLVYPILFIWPFNCQNNKQILKCALLLSAEMMTSQLRWSETSLELKSVTFKE